MRALRNVLGNVYLNSLTRYEQHEQLDSRGGGALSQGAGRDGSFCRYAVQKRAVQFTKKPHSPLFSSETADKLPGIMLLIKASVMTTSRIKLLTLFVPEIFWLAILSIHFPIHFARRAHEYPITLTDREDATRNCVVTVT